MSTGLRFISVCSGIEAASVAWEPLGWKAVAFSEIEPFPCAVLKTHYPDTPNWGDMTKFESWPDADVDLLCGGTPCQSFSVAGLRKGLDDPRGNLMLTFGAIAAKYRPRWLVWENVPGVLSSNGGRDFGTFLGMLGELGYGFAYRVLDAQYFGVAQRRRRVFVVGCLGDWRAAAAVLFERHSLSGHPAPSREAGKVAPTIPSRSTAGGGLGTDFDCDGGVVQVCPTLRAGGNQTGGDRPPGTDVDTADSLIITMAHGQGGAEIAENRSPALTCNHEAPIAAYRSSHRPCEFCGHEFDHDKLGRYGCPNCEGEGLGVTHTLRGEGFDASEEGTGRGTPLVPVAGAICRHSFVGGMGGRPEGAAAGHFVPVAFQQTADCLTAAYGTKWNGNASATNGSLFAGQAMQVRRLTPVECERLQGFPDNYTAIPWRKKPASECPDGPRYKAIGNSWAVPVVRWIGQRIQQVDAITAHAQPELAEAA